jgi:probable HAF family extracellular repeat protein
MKLRFAVLLSVGVMATAGLSRAQSYTVTDLGLGRVAGENRSSAAGLNNLGQAAVTFSSSFNPYGSMATLFSDGTLISLGKFGAADESSATAINNSGEVAGYDYLSTREAQSNAFLYSGGQMRDITSGAAFPFGTTATAMNDSGEVVGYGWPTGAVDHAFLYASGKMIDLGTLGGERSDTSVALGINDAGQVVGNSTTASGQSHAFLYADGVMSDLGPDDASGSNAAAINGNGQIIGEIFIGSSTHAALYENGVWSDLGVGVTPTAINFSGQVVGNMGFLGGGVIYVNGRWVNLNTLILPGSGLSITGAFGINDSGQILCDAVRKIDGETHAVLLTRE